MSLAFYGYPLLIWVAFVPLMLIAGSTTLKLFKKVIAGAVCGLCFYGFALYWVGYVSAFGAVALCAYMTSFILLFVLAGHLVSIAGDGRFLLFAPFFWVVIEQLQCRLFSGFPWLRAAYCVNGSGALAQIAEYTGAGGVSFSILVFNASLIAVLRLLEVKGLAPLQYTMRSSVQRCAVIGLLSVFVIWSAGGVIKYKRNKQFAAAEHEGDKPVRIGVVQGNMLPSVRGDSSDFEKSLLLYGGLSGQFEPGSVDMVVWPETAVPVLVRYSSAYYDTVRKLCSVLNTSMLVGSVDVERVEGKEISYNSAFLFGPGGHMLNRYNKTHLVPFGEFVPFEKSFPSLRKLVPVPVALSAGDRYTVFKLGHAKPLFFSTLVCFEDIFPNIARQFVIRGARLLVNITNDGWFKDSYAAVQHMRASLYRAIENRRYLLRVASTGVTCLIDPMGNVVDIIKEDGRITGVKGHEVFNLKPGRLYFPAGMTFFTRFGNVFGIFVYIIAMLLFIEAIKRIWYPGDRPDSFRY